jgi:hypothetical protein
MTTPDLNEIGEHRPDKYRGWLVFSHLPPDLQDAEDSTQAADHDRFAAVARRYPALTRTVLARPATPAERALLEHLGLELPDKLATHVSYPSPGIRHRSWPQLEIVDPPWTQAEMAMMTPTQEFMDAWKPLGPADEEGE